MIQLPMTSTKSREQTFREIIESTRNTGLAALRPSAKVLEEGLALHADALVLESYSLGIYAGQDWNRLRENKQQGASAVEMKDLVEEHGMLGHLRDEESKRLYEMAWEASGVNGVLQGAGEEGNDPLRLLRRLARYTHLIDAMPDFLARVRTADDLVENQRRGLRSIATALNGVPLAGSCTSVESELALLRVFAHLGARVMHLTYNRRNPIGDGCGETNDGGLSAFGHDAVREMNRLGILIDLAHTGTRTSLDVARCTSSPVMISHSAAYALNPHIRCKTDDVIRAVADTGGFISVTNVPPFLGGDGNIVSLLDHIDYLVREFGPDHVAIGTDRGCILPPSCPEEPDALLRGRTSWESLWPSGHPGHDPRWNKPEQGESMEWTNWPLFTVGLVQRGHSEAVIRKIIGGNILRVIRDVWTMPAALR